MSDVALRPRSSSEILDAAFQLLRQNYAQFVVIGALAFAPQLLFSISDRIGGVAVVGGRIPTWSYPFRFLAFLWLCIADAAMLQAAADAYMGRPVRASSALRTALARSTTILGATLLKYLALFVGLMAGTIAFAFGFALIGSATLAASGNTTGRALGVTLAIAGTVATMYWILYMLVRYFAVPAVTILEGRSSVESLRRSRELGQGFVGKIMKTLVLLYVVYFVLLFAVPAMIGMATKDLSTWAIGTPVAAMLVYPLVAIVTAVLYFDLRIRKEGYDLELMASSLDASPAPAA